MSETESRSAVESSTKTSSRSRSRPRRNRNWYFIFIRFILTVTSLIISFSGGLNVWQSANALTIFGSVLPNECTSDQAFNNIWRHISVMWLSFAPASILIATDLVRFAPFLYLHAFAHFTAGIARFHTAYTFGIPGTPMGESSDIDPYPHATAVNLVTNNFLTDQLLSSQPQSRVESHNHTKERALRPSRRSLTEPTQNSYHSHSSVAAMTTQDTLPERYGIVSVSGVAGAMHIHHSRDASARLIQSQVHIRSATSAVLTRENKFYGLSQSNGTSSPSFLTHVIPLTSTTTNTNVSSTGSMNIPTTLSIRRGGTPESLTALTLSPSGLLLVGGAVSGRIYIWHLLSGALLCCTSCHGAQGEGITALTFCNEGETLLTAGGDASVRLFRVVDLICSNGVVTQNTITATPNPKRHLIGHTLPVISATSYMQMVVTASADRTIRVWHTGSATCLNVTLVPTAPRCMTLYVRHATVQILVGCVDGTVCKIPLMSSSSKKKNNSINKELIFIVAPPTPSVVTSLSISPQHKELVVAYADGVIRTYDTITAIQTHVYTKHGSGSPVSFITTFALPKHNPSNDNNDKTTLRAMATKIQQHNQFPPAPLARVIPSHATSIVPQLLPLDLSPHDMDFTNSTLRNTQSVANQYISSAIDNAFHPLMKDVKNTKTAFTKANSKTNSFAAMKSIMAQHQQLKSSHKTPTLTSQTKVQQNHQGMSAAAQPAKKKVRVMDEDVMVTELVREVTHLRKCNAQLTKAGQKLLEMVEYDLMR